MSEELGGFELPEVGNTKSAKCSLLHNAHHDSRSSTQIRDSSPPQLALPTSRSCSLSLRCDFGRNKSGLPFEL